MPPHNCRCHVFPKMALAVIANWLDINILNNNCFTALCPGLPGWAGYQKKYSPTHCPDHHPVFISFFHLLLSTASSLFKLRAWQCFCTTSLHVLFGLPLGLETSTSYSIHFFTKSVSSFHNTCPYHRNLFCCGINIYIAYSYSFAQLLTWNSFFHLDNTHPSDHSHLCSLKCHLIFFPDRPGLTSA